MEGQEHNYHEEVHGHWLCWCAQPGVLQAQLLHDIRR